METRGVKRENKKVVCRCGKKFDEFDDLKEHVKQNHFEYYKAVKKYSQESLEKLRMDLDE